MKKIISALLCGMLCFLLFIPAYAATENISEKEFFDDGSYIVTSVSDSEKEESQNVFAKIIDLFKRIISLISGKSTISKTKYVYYYDSNNVMLWAVYLKAEFTYSKSGATCNSASVYSEIYDKDWKAIKANATKDLNTARGEFSVRQSKLAVPLKTIERTIVMTCDKNGNIK
ncbi:MAG: hypothetical protein NC122_03135 [Faecalibacterium sp.]|nr:hypothetical protein [Ruminococcus sp.]MCM1392489.1 hypothetical protein [Ruminococcus sp.]MCM1485180.1 hypothetical protein [Faecalibacterium sp.]